MATFKVGQRVRITSHVWGGDPAHHPQGKEGNIVGVGEFIGSDTLVYEFKVDIGSPSTVLCQAWEIEPIVDDGRQVITWDACCWLPEHMREGVKEAA